MIDRRRGTHSCGGANKKREYESDNVVMACPEVNVDGGQNTEEGKTPGDTINDDVFPSGEELVDNSTEKEDVNEGPARRG